MSSVDPAKVSTPPGVSLSLAWVSQDAEKALCPGSHRELVVDLGQDPKPPAPVWAYSGHRCAWRAPSGDSAYASAPPNPARKRERARGLQQMIQTQACYIPPGASHPKPQFPPKRVYLSMLV